MKRLFVEAPLPFEEAARWATDDELTTARSFAAARGREYLAWRAIVRRELGHDTAIAYNSIGAPILTNQPLHISVSHCQGYIAVGLSDKPCAIDIERIERDFTRVLSRYLSPEEQRILSHPLFPAVAWCAKEVLYKYAGRQELDLLQNLHIDRISFPESSTPKRDTLPATHFNAPCGTIYAHYTNIDKKPVRQSTAMSSVTSPLAETPDNSTKFNRTLHFYKKKDSIVVFLFD